MSTSPAAAAAAAASTDDSTQYPDPDDLNRSDLQRYLKQWGVKAIGTTNVLRERYAEYVGSFVAPATAAAAASQPVEVTQPPTVASLEPAPAPPKTPEKRARKFISHCSSKTQDRIERALTQRMYLVEAGEVKDLSCEFTVLGSTGNVYTVKIETEPSCTCFDHQNGNLCKHILFVLLKVMRVDSESNLIYQNAWLSSELDGMFSGFRERMRQVSGSVLANEKVRTAYASMKKGEEVKVEEGGVARKDIDQDEDCPICFDPMDSSNPGALVYCRVQCGANFHKDCVQRWSSQKSSPTCPMCRCEWVDANAKRKQDGFENLGALQGQSTKRDTSTYNKRSRWW